MHVLPALAAGAHGGDFEVALVHLDVDLVLHVGRDLDGAERGMAPGVRVKGADAHQPVDAHLGAQIAIGEGAAGGERRAIDARLVAGLVVDHLRLEAAPLAPAQIHAQQHGRPIFRFGAAGARVDAHDRVGVGGGPRQHALELGPARAIGQRLPLPFDLLHDRLVALGFAEIEQLDRVGNLAGEARDRAQRLLYGGALAQQRLGLLLVVPEIGAARQLVELF